MNQTISYQLRWFHIGDPDNLWFAIAYGIVALTTIWVLEHIFQRLLYSQSDGILLSDAAALVAYSGSGPLQLCRWLFAPKQRYCRRALVATGFRVCLLIVDAFIVILSIPRSIPVLESDVMSTQLSFKPNASRLDWDTTNHIAIPCKPDAIQYSGFSPSTTRQLCLISMPVSDPEILSLRDVLNGNNSLLYALQRTDNGEGLFVISVHDSTYYVLSLALSVNDNQNLKQYFLHTPLDIAEQAASAMQRLSNMRLCQRRSLDSGLTLLACPVESASLIDNVTLDENVHELYSSMGTEKVQPSITKFLSNSGEAVRTFPVIGSVNRPRLSILPALILITGLLIVHGLLRMVQESQDLEYKLWLYIYGVLDSEKRENPLESACMKLSLHIADPNE